MSFKNPIQLLIVLLVQGIALALPPWSYDAGPDATTDEGKELITLNAEIPNMPALSEAMMGRQKFRPAFGPVLWRMRQGKNTIKILFIGQDATHIAEAAGRTATAGFGGRAQDLARYFGVNESAAFMNTYAFTIKGQYGSFDAPYLQKNEDGEEELKFGSFVDNQLWLMTQDQASPITRWRNRYIDWVIRNNPDSLQLIVLFGGAARDAIGSFVESKGGTVEPRLSDEELKSIRVPESVLKYAGGNNEFPVPVTSTGDDLYQALLDRKVNYSKPEDQQAAKDALEDNLGDAIESMVFTNGGPYANGIVHPAQLGGYDLRKMTINKKYKTLSLAGLGLSDGTIIKNVLVAQLPHPSALSRLKKEQASEKVKQSLKAFKPYVQLGWTIEADPGQTNQFASGKDYVYSRADIGPEYYDFGAPAIRMVPVSTASRLKPHIIVFGTRDRAEFDGDEIDEMAEASTSETIDLNEMWTARPRGTKSRFVFDPGPGEIMAKIMKTNLNLEDIFEIKSGKSWNEDGIEAYYVKSHPDVGDFGHYRGTFDKPRVVILADPSGYDDLITARALTGTRGQFLHGLMQDLGVDENYLVIKTVPFGMDDATPKEWKRVLSSTVKYREAIFEALLKHKDHLPQFILTDGTYAAQEIASLLNETAIPVVSLTRSKNNGSDMRGAGRSIATKIVEFEGRTITAKMAAIPRSHLSYYARIWEGTSGDRVLNASDKFRGQGFAEVAPRWAFEQELPLSKGAEEDGVKACRKILKDGGLILPGESIEGFFKRLGRRSDVFTYPRSRFDWAA